MRVLQVITNTDRRGAQVFAADLAGALGRCGHEVETIALVRGSTGGVPAEPIAETWPSTQAVRTLRARMAGVDVTIAHGSSTGPACALAGLGRARARPFVYRQISDTRFWAPTQGKRLRVRAVLACARSVVALSEFNRDQLVRWIGVRRDRVVVVPNGVPSARYAPASVPQRAKARAELGLPDAPVVLFIGALVPEKGADRAITCIARLPGVHLVVAGAGPERWRLDQLAHALAPDRVHFLGTTPDTAALYAAADLLVLPSRGGDAMPAVLIEAGLCGLPVVSTRVGAIPEVVVDRQTGFVVAPDDDDGFVRAATRLLDDPDTRATMGAAARTHCVARYDIDRVAELWEAVLTRAAR